MTIVDAGPLVAFILQKDSFHVWAVENFKSAEPPLVTCEAVWAEVDHISSRFPKGFEGFRAICRNAASTRAFRHRFNVNPFWS